LGLKNKRPAMVRQVAVVKLALSADAAFQAAQAILTMAVSR
jgi:hypothetical protein